MFLQCLLSELPLRGADVSLHVQVVLRVGDDEQLQLLGVEDDEVAGRDGAGQHSAALLQNDPLSVGVAPDGKK